MACILYDKNGKRCDVEARFVEHMLRQGYSAEWPVKKKEAIKEPTKETTKQDQAFKSVKNGHKNKA